MSPQAATVEGVRPSARELISAVQEKDSHAATLILDQMSHDEIYAMAILLASVVDTSNPVVAVAVSNVDRTSVERFTRIASVAASVLDVELQQLYGRDRNIRLAHARQVVCAVARWMGIPVTQIGRLIGRDHATVIYAVKKVNASEQLTEAARRIMVTLSTQQGLL